MHSKACACKWWLSHERVHWTADVSLILLCSLLPCARGLVPPQLALGCSMCVQGWRCCLCNRVHDYWLFVLMLTWCWFVWWFSQTRAQRGSCWFRDDRGVCGVCSACERVPSREHCVFRGVRSQQDCLPCSHADKSLILIGGKNEQKRDRATTRLATCMGATTSLASHQTRKL